MNRLSDLSALAGRFLLALIFVLSGATKIPGYAGTQAYMESMNVPGELLPLVILTELAGGLLVMIGLWTRGAAFVLAGFTLVAAALFHANFADQMQMIMFLKNVAIAGGFLALVAHGPGAWSVDARRAGAVR